MLSWLQNFVRPQMVNGAPTRRHSNKPEKPLHTAEAMMAFQVTLMQVTNCSLLTKMEFVTV